MSFFQPRSDDCRRRRRRRRRDWNNHRSTILNNTISHILPSSPIVEVASSLSSKQFNFLTNGPKYIPVCQSRFSSLSIDTMIQREHEKLVQLFKIGLNDNYMSASDQSANELFIPIKHLLYELLIKPLSSRLLVRARYDYQMINTIDYIRKQQQIVLQRTDKSKVFHLASVDSYHHKSLDYMQKIKAYKELENGINPCMNHLHQVLALINPLLKKKAVNLQIWKQSMYLNIKNIELAHLYFISKPHKV